MSNTRSWYLLTALALVLASIEPSSADSRANAPDYWAASKTSLQQAYEHRRLNETQAACDALGESLEYYRMALAREALPSNATGLTRIEEGDAMQEIRARFGCTRMQLG